MSARVRRVTIAAALASTLCAAVPASGLMVATGARIDASFAPYRIGTRTAGTISLSFSGGAGHVPAPLSGMVLRLPAGLRLELMGTATCSPARLRNHGASGCTARSLLGRGHALLEVHAGSQTLPEGVAISVFRGPDRGPQPTLEIFGQGSTPLHESAISTAVLGADAAPFGSRLTVAVPAIPTLTYEPNASFASLSLTIGNAGAGSRSAIVLPPRCPSDGFPFAASFVFADGSTTSASTKLRCP